MLGKYILALCGVELECESSPVVETLVLIEMTRLGQHFHGAEPVSVKQLSAPPEGRVAIGVYDIVPLIFSDTRLLHAEIDFRRPLVGLDLATEIQVRFRISTSRERRTYVA